MPVGQPQLNIQGLINEPTFGQRRQQGLEASQKKEIGEQTIKANQIKIDAAEKQAKLDKQIDSYLESGKPLSDAPRGVAKALNSEIGAAFTNIKTFEESGVDAESLTTMGNAMLAPYKGALGVKEESMQWGKDEKGSYVKWTNDKSELEIQRLDGKGLPVGDSIILGKVKEESGAEFTSEKLINTEQNRASDLLSEELGIPDPQGGGIFMAPTDPSSALRYHVIAAEIGNVRETELSGREIFTKAKANAGATITRINSDLAQAPKELLGPITDKATGITFIRNPETAVWEVAQ